MRKKTDGSRTISSAAFNQGGIVALTASLAMAAGFWIAEAGIRWLPTMLSIITSLCLAALVAITAAQFLAGEALESSIKGVKMRKRIKALLTLVILAGVARLCAYCIAVPCALTALPGDQYEAVFASDRQRFSECDTGLQRSLQTLKATNGLFNQETQRTLSHDEEREMRQLWTEIYDYGFCLDTTRQFHENWHRFDPSRSGRKYHVRSFMLCFGSDLVLYEHAREICDLIETNENVVKFLNAPDADGHLGEDSFSRFRNQLTDTSQSARIATGIGYFFWLDNILPTEKLSSELQCHDLWQRVADGCQMAKSTSRIRQLGVAVGGNTELLKRGVRRTWFPLQKNVAEWMGHTRVQRVGEYLISDSQIDEIIKLLEPGDIMLGRKNWYLSNVGLPGFWPHGILYVGSQQQMKAYFDGDAETRQYIARISGREMDLCEYLALTYPMKWRQFTVAHKGRSNRIIEAVSAGVVFHTFPQTRGDYMAAIRPNLPKSAKAAAIIEAFSHLGKPYDYEFDFATDHALVCTELIWRCYRPAEGKPGLTLGPIDYAGRKTLPANEIAIAYVNDVKKAKTGSDISREFSFVLFYDASEESGKAFASDEASFMESTKRSKWSAQQD